MLATTFQGEFVCMTMMRFGALLLLSLTSNHASAQMLMGRKSEMEVIATLLESDRITRHQFDLIASKVVERPDLADESNERSHSSSLYEVAAPGELRELLEKEVLAGTLSQDSFDYLSRLFLLFGSSDNTSGNPVSANYDTENTNGIVKYLGIFRRPIDRVLQGESLGIWGFAKGNREYALQTTERGLHIIDVTIPSFPISIQFIRMGIGLYGWRDVVTYTKGSKTYAYVHAQASRAIFNLAPGELRILDLSNLSGSMVPSLFLPPIRGTAQKLVEGFGNLGHTIHASQEAGYLFLNSATLGDGVYILDISQDPWNPVWVAQWTGGDGHDVSVRTGWQLPGMGLRDVMIASDGYEGKHRLVDITGLREEYATTGDILHLDLNTSRLLGSANPFLVNSYAHSNTVKEDTNTLYVTDEFNLFDVGIFDISDPSQPVQTGVMQWSGDGGSVNVPVHNLHVLGDYLLAAYYSAGFRVFDISSDTEPAVEVGKYETFRAPHNSGRLFEKPLVSGFVGAWNLYAGLPSGRILCSDSNGGTLILSLDPNDTSTCWIVCWILRILDFLIFWN